MAVAKEHPFDDAFDPVVHRVERNADGDRHRRLRGEREPGLADQLSGKPIDEADGDHDHRGDRSVDDGAIEHEPDVEHAMPENCVGEREGQRYWRVLRQPAGYPTRKRAP